MSRARWIVGVEEKNPDQNWIDDDWGEVQLEVRVGDLNTDDLGSIPALTIEWICLRDLKEKLATLC